jgi:hypothetical protein
MQELKELDPKVGNLLNMEQRMNERENCMLRKSYNPVQGKVLGDITQKRRKEMVEEMVSKFGEQVIGIHGQELPKYSETEASKKYWEQGQPSPKIQCLHRLKQERKWWAPPEEMYLNTCQSTSASPDHFKLNRIPKPKEKEVPEKVTSMSVACEPRVAEWKKGHVMKQTWSSKNDQFNHLVDERMTDKILRQAAAKNRQEIERELAMQRYLDKSPRGLGFEF